MSDKENLAFQLARAGVSDSLSRIIIEGLPDLVDQMKLVMLLESEFFEKSLPKSFSESFCFLVDEGLSTVSNCLKAIILLSEQELFKGVSLAKIIGYLTCCVEYQKTHPDCGDLAFLAIEFTKSDNS